MTKQYVLPVVLGLLLIGIAVYYITFYGIDVIGMSSPSPIPPIPPGPPKPF